MRMCDPGATPSTVSFDPKLSFTEFGQTGARGGKRTHGAKAIPDESDACFENPKARNNV
jgi:hypothetical protein